MKGLTFCADITWANEDPFIFDRMFHAGDAFLSVIAPSMSIAEAFDKATLHGVQAAAKGETIDLGTADIQSVDGVVSDARVYSDALCLFVQQDE